MHMLIMNVKQTNETKGITSFAKSADSAQEAASQKEVVIQKEVAMKLQNAKEGATVTISAEGLGLSQENIMQKNMYQEMMESAKENAEAEGKGFQDMAKALEIARRILDGDIVPSEDEQFLMEYDNELYMRVKSMARPKENPKEYETLLEEDEERKEDGTGGATIDGSHIASNTSDFPSGSIEKMKVSQV